MMNTHTQRPDLLERLALAFFVVFPSLTFVSKRFGLLSAMGYALMGICLLPFVIQKLSFIRVGRLQWKGVVALLIVGMLLLCIAFEFAYPIANSGRFGPGSDRDEALNQAVAALFRGEYPYHQKTYLGNPISPMPGSLVLAAPFYFFLGNGAYQTIFWIFVFSLILIERRCVDSFPRLLVFGLTWMLSPALAQEFLTGGDLIANSLFMAAATYWVIRGTTEAACSGWQLLMASALLGICLSSRANFVTIMPIVFFAVARERGYAFAVRHGLIAAVIFATLTGAFYFHDPASFSPLHTANKLARFDAVLPHAAVVVPLATLVISCVIGLIGNLRHVYMHIAAVLALPVVASVLLQSIQASRLNLDSADFALPALVFAVLGWRVRGQPTQAQGGGAV